jgi:hypothetical protein
MVSSFRFAIRRELPWVRRLILHSDAGTKVRLGLECDGDRVSLFTCNGYDWTKRYPWIVESTLEAVRH